MLKKLLVQALMDKDTRETLFAAIVSIIFIIVALIYSLFASPVAMLTGQFDKVFSDSDMSYEDIINSTDFEDGESAMGSTEKYIINYQQYQQNFEDTLNVEYEKIWKQTYQEGLELANRLAEEKEEEYEEKDRVCTVTSSGYSIVVGTFGMSTMYGSASSDTDSYAERLTEAASGIEGGIDRIRINDGSMALSSYNTLLMHRDCYTGKCDEDCDEHGTLTASQQAGMKAVWSEMDIDDDNEDETLTTASGLVKLIKKNASGFFEGHVPTESGYCYPRNRAYNVTFSLQTDRFPTTYDSLKSLNVGEPYVGIYSCIEKEDCDCDDDDDEDGTTHHHSTKYHYSIRYTVVSFVEYKGQSFLDKHLYLNAFPNNDNYIYEIYSNLCSIVGEDIENNAMLSDYSLGLDPSLTADAKERDEKIGARDYDFGDGDTTRTPVDMENTYISCYYHGTNYIQDRIHWGMDFATGESGRPIYATTAGEVIRTGMDSDGFGNYCVIYQGKNSAGDRYYCIYAHMVEAPMVSTGSTVRAGQQIGKVGSTGFSTGPHLHYEVRVVRANGKIESIDPMSDEGGLMLD